MYRKNLTKPDGRPLYLYSSKPISDDIVATNPKHEEISATPHQRWHPLRREWVIFASHRQNRTFLPPKNYSPLLETAHPDFPTEMPKGDYEVAVFENLFPSLNLSHHDVAQMSVQSRESKGVCEVVVFTKDPDTSLGQLTKERIELILEVWGDRTKELSKNPDIQYVLPFENRGVEMGVTLHHPHGQIYSYSFIPPVQERQFESMKDFWDKNKLGLLEKIILDEKRDHARIIMETDHMIAFVPIFARYPYETWIVPKRKTPYLFELTKEERGDLSIVLKTILLKFDHLWNKTFPYLMTINQAPVKGDHPDKHLFFQFIPPYRTRDKLKFLAGTELGAGVFVNDSLPEEKALELRNVTIEGFQ